MSQFRPDSQMHRARLSRNLGLGAVLISFVALVFALTVVKVTRGNPMQGFDHQPRIEMVPEAKANP